MKRSLFVVPFAFALVAGCSSSPTSATTSVDGGGDTGAPIVRAKQLVAAGNFDEALLVTDSILAKAPNDHAARLLAADANMALAQAGRGNVQAFLLDAVHNFEVAAKSKPTDAATRLRLADAYLKTSSFDKGRNAALEAARILRDQRADAAAIGAALIAAADNEMQKFVDLRTPEIARDEPPSEAAVKQAQAVLAHLTIAKQGLRGKAAVRTARVYQWLGQHEPALAELERGIQADPTEPEVHIAYQDFMLSSGKRGDCVAAYKRILADAGDNPTILFYLGRAQYSVADGLRSRGQWSEADADYQEAHASFQRYRTLRPTHKNTASHWQAMCKLSRARMALDAGEHDQAKQLYYAAYATDPRVLAKDASGTVAIVDTFGGTYAGGLFMVGTALAEGSSQDSLRQALAFFEEVIAKHHDAIPQFYNNAGLAARDLGASVVASDEKQAMDLWERSYRYYSKAVELVPDDPRIVNDCGLMLVYHLKREYDRAKTLFDRAIQLGEAQIAELPVDASEEQRHFLEEAVGDAYQNLAVMARQQGKSFADYKDVLEKAVLFYPYQRRTAAQLLRTQGTRAEGLPGQTAPSLTPEQRRQREAQRDAADAFKTAAADASTALAEGDFDAALLALDTHARTLDGYAPFHTMVGRCSLLYANQARANGGPASQIDGLYADATTHLTRARELDGESSETRYWLVKALNDSGKFAPAAQEAASLLSHIRSVGHADGVDLLEVHRARADAAARAYIDGKQAERDDADTLRAARESLRYLSENDQLDGGALKTWIGLEQWAGAPAQALEVAVKAIRSETTTPEVLDQGVTLAAQLGQSDKVVAALAGSADATKQWYLGKAWFQRAQELWATDKPAALRAIDASGVAFAAAKSANPDYADSSDQWLALALGSKGVMLLGDGETEQAQAVLLQSLRLRPDCATSDLGGGSSTKRAVLVLGSKYQRDLAKLEGLMRAATEAVADDVDFANNHGLAARDYGNALERAGDAKQAHAMYEASYESYKRASAADPTNVRLRNDCALMLIYHLHRDLDEAVATLESARDDGLRQIQNNPPSTPQERQDLEEAVGDCVENLGYYYEVHAKDPAKAIAAYKKSLAFYPGDQRAATRRLRALEGGGDK